MAQEKQHQTCVSFLKNPQQAFLDAKKHSQDAKNAQFRLLFTNEPVSAGSGPKTKKRKTFGGFLSKSKKKVRLFVLSFTRIDRRYIMTLFW